MNDVFIKKTLIDFKNDYSILDKDINDIYTQIREDFLNLKLNNNDFYRDINDELQNIDKVKILENNYIFPDHLLVENAFSYCDILFETEQFDQGKDLRDLSSGFDRSKQYLISFLSTIGLFSLGSYFVSLVISSFKNENEREGITKITIDLIKNITEILKGTIFSNNTVNFIIFILSILMIKLFKGEIYSFLKNSKDMFISTFKDMINGFIYAYTYNTDDYKAKTLIINGRFNNCKKFCDISDRDNIKKIREAIIRERDPDKADKMRKEYLDNNSGLKEYIKNILNMKNPLKVFSVTEYNKKADCLIECFLEYLTTLFIENIKMYMECTGYTYKMDRNDISISVILKYPLKNECTGLYKNINEIYEDINLIIFKTVYNDDKSKQKEWIDNINNKIRQNINDQQNKVGLKPYISDMRKVKFDKTSEIKKHFIK